MTKRYAVSNGTRTIAFVHATNIADAVRIACQQAPDHKPTEFVAVPLGPTQTRSSSGRFGRAELDHDS